MNNKDMSNHVFFDILAEKIKRDSHEEYNRFVNYVNALAKDKGWKELQEEVVHLQAFLSYLDDKLAIIDDYEDIMNMKATLLDMIVNDLNDTSVYLLVEALMYNKELNYLQSFVSPVEYWVSVIKAKERLYAA
ncbi:hypothetical protein [Cytobacillus kochii]|uniref:hypothetical protein n=1 Tax=Cytobacillus kochii TaxID=859143 RepID=UPI00203BCD2F|nr:hypothetical protein [Cytobacillus kochii]MCM3323930.1 hypothetical protein [Cytobacillus kochii]MCM3346327.1 hypothetical protein [Cytobacillus kochii]